MVSVGNAVKSFLELFFPQTCSCCGNTLVGEEGGLCLYCQLHLPETDFACRKNNAIEHRMAGRVPFVAAMSLLVFVQGGITQQLIHNIKYRGGRRLAYVMGHRMGKAIAFSGRFGQVDALVPVPLHPRKERRRGYNQSLLLCEGLSDVLKCPIEARSLVRTKNTATQTSMSREERAENMCNVFSLNRAERLEGRHILLVDDVMTTGATISSCWDALKEVKGIRISIATLAISGED
ncbi:MAG: ComF family protein [Bacteroidales bacterium]|nr:ComF family protein [Bacteroidales bacterium]